MAKYDYTLVTIGAGSGGVRASRMAAQMGAKVAICEASRVGGTCVIRGCIPKKLLVYGAHFADDFEDAASYGWTIPVPTFNWPALIAAKDKEIDRLNGIYLNILKTNGVELLEGRAILVDPHTVEVAGRRITAANILIATGSWPILPKIPGIEHAITSNEALELKALPKRLAIVGGGYIAVEFAGIFNGLGAQVTQIIRADKLLRGFDEDLRDVIGEEMTKKGIEILASTQVSAIAKTADGFRLNLDTGRLLTVNSVMYATGRAPMTDGIGLAEAGVEIDKGGAVTVDRYSRSSLPHIFAVGDVTDRINLTPVAIKEGAAVATTLFGGTPTEADHNDVPSAVFSQPPIATVGLNETEARAIHGDIDVYVSSFRPLKFTLTERKEITFVKLIVERAYGRVIGCHMLGMDAAEIIQGFAVAIKCGATKAQFDATVGIHPSAAEEFVTMKDPRPSV